MLVMRIMASIILGFVMSIFAMTTKEFKKDDKREKIFGIIMVLLLAFVVITIWVV